MARTPTAKQVIKQMRADGRGINKIVYALNRQRVPCPGAKLWTYYRVRKHVDAAAVAKPKRGASEAPAKKCTTPTWYALGRLGGAWTCVEHRGDDARAAAMADARGFGRAGATDRAVCHADELDAYLAEVRATRITIVDGAGSAGAEEGETK